MLIAAIGITVILVLTGLLILANRYGWHRLFVTTAIMLVTLAASVVVAYLMCIWQMVLI